MNGRDKQTDCLQQRNNAWLPPPERMQEELEVVQIAQKSSWGKFRYQTEKRKFPHSIVPFRNPPSTPFPDFKAILGHGARARGQLRHRARLSGTRTPDCLSAQVVLPLGRALTLTAKCLGQLEGTRAGMCLSGGGGGDLVDPLPPGQPTHLPKPNKISSGEK